MEGNFRNVPIRSKNYMFPKTLRNTFLFEKAVPNIWRRLFLAQYCFSLEFACFWFGWQMNFVIILAYASSFGLMKAHIGKWFLKQRHTRDLWHCNHKNQKSLWYICVFRGKDENLQNENTPRHHKRDSVDISKMSSQTVRLSLFCSELIQSSDLEKITAKKQEQLLADYADMMFFLAFSCCRSDLTRMLFSDAVIYW